MLCSVPVCLLCFNIGWASGRACKKWATGCLHGWLSVWSEVQIICIWSGWCHCHPIVSYFVKVHDSLTFLMPAYSGRPRKDAVKRVSVCLSVCLSVFCVPCLHFKNEISGRLENRQELITRWDSERELFTTTSYMQKPAPTPIEPTS